MGRSILEIKGHNMEYQYSDNEVVSDLIASIVTEIKNGETDFLNVPPPLREVLRNFANLYTDGVEMHNGVDGLPNTTAKLVKLGVCYIKGNFVYLHQAVCDAVKEKNLKRERLLERLKQHPANKNVDLSEF